MPNRPGGHAGADMLDVFAIVIQPGFAIRGNSDLFASRFIITEGDIAMLLKEIQRWVDHAGAWGVVAAGQRFYLLNQLITVARAPGQNV